MTKLHTRVIHQRRVTGSSSRPPDDLPCDSPSLPPSLSPSLPNEGRKSAWEEDERKLHGKSSSDGNLGKGVSGEVCEGRDGLSLMLKVEGQGRNTDWVVVVP